MVFFWNKNSLLSVIKDEKINKYWELFKQTFKLNEDRYKISNLKKYLELRLSNQHPLTKIIEFWIGFHNWDLPKDVRVEIENAYKKWIIKVLLTTSTLSEGVNLPIKNLIFHSLYGMNIWNFRNIIWRVWRAMKETEWNIYFINSDRWKIEQNNSAELVIKSWLSSIEINDWGNKKYVDFLDYVSWLDEEQRNIIVKDFDRLQVFIYTIYEYLKNDNEDISLDYIKLKVTSWLYFTDKNQEEIDTFNWYYDYAYTRVEEIYSSSPQLLKTINKTWLSFPSVQLMYEIYKQISFIPHNKIDIMWVQIIDPIPKFTDIITEDIFAKILWIKEFSKIIYSSHFENLDNYSILLSWIRWDTFLHIRDTFFIYESDITKRTHLSVKYIAEMFEYILPWAFSSLSVLCEGLGQEKNILTEIKLLPLKVKHWVQTGYWIELVKLWIEYHELLVELEKFYLIEKERFDLEVGKLDFFDQEVFLSIWEWLLSTSFHILESQISIIKNNTSFIKNIWKVKNKLKEKTNILDEDWKLEFKIQWIFNNEFNNYDISKINNEEIFSFQRQYNNIYDYFAIRVYYWDGLLWYIQSDYSEELSEYLQNGINFEVIEINNNWKDITLIIRTIIEF